MKRRTRNLFILLLSILLGNIHLSADNGKTVVVENKLNNQSLFSIPYRMYDGVTYIPLADLVDKASLGIYTNESRQKTVVYVGAEKVTFTAHNPFIILNNQTYQILYTPKWVDGEMWVSAKEFAQLFFKYTAQKFSFDEKEKILTLGAKDVNITGITIESKENGTLIKFTVNKKFKKSDITLKVANGWFHTDIYGAKVDSVTLKQTKTSGIISKIEVIPFKQLVSIAFKLRKKIISKDAFIAENGKEIIVTLRTNDVIKEPEKPVVDLEREKKAWLIDTIIIDAGHGGKDPGALGRHGLKEKDITLAVALKLGKLIEKEFPNTKVVYTRKTDIFIPLWKRTKIANENRGKLFISLHCNSNNNRNARGFETYFLSADKDKNKQAQSVVLKENASIKFEKQEDQKRYKGINFILATMAQSAFIRQSQYLASTIQNSFASNLKPMGLKDRGVKQGRFWVMVGATMPNVLIEMGFVSNRKEANFLKKNASQHKIAKSIFEGIKKYKNDIETAI